MNFKSILVLGLSVATLGLSLPAHADDTATSVQSTQDAIITGDGNNTNQNNFTNVHNSKSGRRSGHGATGTAVNSSQTADVQGNDNNTQQNNSTTVTNSKRRHR